MNKRMRAVFVNLLMVVLLLSISACATNTRNRVLDDSLKLYSSAIRWGDFMGATKFYKSPELFAQVNFERLKSVKVTSYDVVGGAFSPDGNMLKQSVRIRYYDTGVGKETEILDSQVWEYNSEREVWLLTSQMPDLL